ncbi:MAG: bacillithiol biosynthesis BshC [Hymenobacter sp.]
MVTSLFGEYGLVCLDADRPALKQALKPLLAKEITRSSFPTRRCRPPMPA